MQHTARFFGGPLDGRESPLSDDSAVAGQVLTHIHLHGGPKIETRYQLRRTDEGDWEYRLIDHG